MSNKKRIILIGDSLTEWNFKGNGWGKKMQDWYGEKVTVVNAGYAGYNSRMIKEMIHQIVPKNKNEILICTILLGTNDCFYNIRKLSSQEYKINMLYIIDYIHSVHPKTEILVITPPVSGSPFNMLPYVNALYEIKQERNYINIVDLHTNPHNLLISPSDLYDGIHLNDSGNDKLFKLVQNSIFYYYNHYIPSNLL